MASQHRPRTLILDTSVFIDDPNVIEGFPDDTVIISPWVIDEIDHLKRSEGERGAHARLTSRMIDEYCASGQLCDGITLKNGGILKSQSEYAPLPAGVEQSADNKTIFLAQRMKSETPHDDIIVISKDINLRIKASMFGVRSGDYESEHAAEVLYDALAGQQCEIILNNKLAIDELYRNLWVDLATVIEASASSTEGLVPNQLVHLSFDGKTTLAMYKKDQQILRLIPKPRNGKAKKGIGPINCEQAFVYGLLTDPKIHLVAIMGKTGSGKTLMSLLGAYEQLGSEHEKGVESGDSAQTSYDQILVFRPNIEIGQPLGFLPGTVDEKFEPWMDPIFDNLHLIMQHTAKEEKRGKQNDPVQSLIDLRMLDIRPINHIRGRTFNHKFIIIDDAQNLTCHQVKSVITRSGKGSKVVLTGDIGQIDNPYVDRHSNGLSEVISRFSGQEIFGHAIMKKCERSFLAQLADELL
ncbi:MAG: PhoH family protein [Candidatus Sungbacteria bacterium]|nr:PhoH family protein [bacterium]MDZ4260172.1 PhoH family protein [Candidatus Sungbacteria bacterium]